MPADEQDAYVAIAAWYDAEHDQHTDDVECYQELLASHARAGASVLEIGSGTARIAAALALAGYAVTGIEPSAAMRARGAKRLAALPERVARRVRTVAGSATAPGLRADEAFDAALLGCNTFAHLTTLDERQAALARLRDHLRPAGVLLLDLDLAGPERMAETVGQVWYSGTWDVPNSAEQVLHFSVAGHGEEPGTLQITHFYDVIGEGGVVRRIVSRMALALLGQGEVEEELTRAGFAVAARYGSYDMRPWEDGAPRAIFVARCAP